MMLLTKLNVNTAFVKFCYQVPPWTYSYALHFTNVMASGNVTSLLKICYSYKDICLQIVLKIYI